VSSVSRADGLEKCANQATLATIAVVRYIPPDITYRERMAGNRMARKRDLKFFDCPGCKKVILLTTTAAESTCPGCGSANGQVISSAELERRIEEGAVFNIDLTSGVGGQPKRQ